MKAISVIFENDEILLVNKSSGLAVQGGKGISHPLDEELSRQLGYKIHLVHRLDKDTEGILIVAKSAASASKWTKLISSKEVQKEYSAISFGLPRVNGKILKEGLLESNIEAHGREVFAKTYFSVLKSADVIIEKKVEGQEDSGEKIKMQLSLINLKLATGRMHQIRIQMAEAGAPLCGDDLHGNFKLNKILKKEGCKKLCLAARKLTIPLDGKMRTFEIPLPDHMQSLIDRFF